MLCKAGEKVAVVGMGCRLPPSCAGLDSFWNFLMRGGNALKPPRKDRWDARQFFDADPARPGKTHAPKFGMLESDPRQFDPTVFGISPREAAVMDPMQRMLLESTWEAMEEAGFPVDQLRGSRTGVFIGGFCLDHLILQMQPSNRHLMEAHSPVGATMTLLSNRLSHAFDFRGPSLTLDTACSSSLVALHYACQSLLSGESNMAVAGGVNSIMRPEYPIMMSKGHFLSHHGECHTFDVTAAGYARGEGAGVFLLKRLSDAVAAGDVIHAVICGTGVNQDGRTEGISLPNSAAQEELARRVYQECGIAPGEVDYLEAHGTGTQAGDPAEMRALNAVFSEGRKSPLPVGSVKTNIGHLEAAAGFAGMLKCIGVLKNRKVPANLHFENPNPSIPFDEYCLQVVDAPMDLPPASEKSILRVAVNSCGYGGTNAHVVLESPPEAPVPDCSPFPKPALIPFSAADRKALADLAGKLAFQAANLDSESLSDFAHSLAFRRSHLPCRAVAILDDPSHLREQLIAASTAQTHENLVTGMVSEGSRSGLVFVFTGMGPQWWAMGQELMKTEPDFPLNFL